MFKVFTVKLQLKLQSNVLAGVCPLAFCLVWLDPFLNACQTRHAKRVWYTDCLQNGCYWVTLFSFFAWHAFTYDIKKFCWQRSNPSFLKIIHSLTPAETSAYLQIVGALDLIFGAPWKGFGHRRLFAFVTKVLCLVTDL